MLRLNFCATCRCMEYCLHTRNTDFYCKSEMKLSLQLDEIKKLVTQC